MSNENVSKENGKEGKVDEIEVERYERVQQRGAKENDALNCRLIDERRRALKISNMEK